MNLILTNKGEELASNGFLTGVFPKITKVVFGDGNGINVIPSKTMTTLIHPIQEGVGTALARISNPNGLYIYTQIPASVGGFTVREIGLFTDDDILIAVGGNFEKVKPPVSDSIEKLDFYITVPLSSAQEITVEFSNDNIYADQSAVDIIHNSIELRRLEVLTLQGQMPTKVSISNIIDNVTSSNTDKPLSAKQGKELKDLVDAKQAIINNNSLNINKIDVNAGIEINSLLVDTDTFIVDDGGTNTIRKSYISRIWTYISSKLTGAISTVLTSNLTAGKTVVTDVNGKLGVSSITTTELGYLAGVGSSIQTQINGKAPTNQVMYLGTSALPINRASAALSLLGVSIDGNAGTATKLSTARSISISGGAVGTATNFDGTTNISIPITSLNGNSIVWSTTPDVGKFNTSTTVPSASNRINYNGYFYCTYLNLSASGDTTAAATHYYTEIGSDGFVRPKPLASVKLEIAGDRAPIANPTLTGIPRAPTAANRNNSTQIATTAYVDNAMSVGRILGRLSFNGSTMVVNHLRGIVTGVVRNATGNYTVSITAQADTLFTVGVGHSGGGQGYGVYVVAKTTTTITLTAAYGGDNTVGAYNPTIVDITIFGD